MVRNCPMATPVSFMQPGGGVTPFYAVSQTPSVNFRLPARNVPPILQTIDSKEVVLGDDDIPIPLQYTLAQSYPEKEIFEVNKQFGVKPEQVGCLWSLTSTVKLSVSNS